MRTHQLLIPCAALLCSAAAAGPLNPPAGAIAATGKTIAEVEPRTALSSANTPGDGNSVYKITQPGSYYLTGDIDVPAGRYGVWIQASGVTVDLNGFTIRGGSAGVITGGVGVNTRNTVRNGSVSGGTSGVVLVVGGAGSGLGSIVENIRISSVAGRGIDVGEHSLVRSCAVDNAGAEGIYTAGKTIIESCSVNVATTGIQAGSSTRISDCRISGASSGISCSTACTVTGCIATGNANTGFYLDNQSTISGCVATGNGGSGIVLNNGCAATDNTSSGNGLSSATGAGVFCFSFSSGNRIEGNRLNNNDYGVRLEGPGNFVARNTARGNSTANWYITAGNAVAPIVNATTNAALINGATAATTLGSTDPNANFSY